jgi:hypothetical protein
MLACGILAATWVGLAVRYPDSVRGFLRRGLPAVGAAFYLGLVLLEQIDCRDRWVELIVWPDLTILYWFVRVADTSAAPLSPDPYLIRAAAAVGVALLATAYPRRPGAFSAAQSLAGVVIWLGLPILLIRLFQLPCRHGTATSLWEFLL